MSSKIGRIMALGTAIVSVVLPRRRVSEGSFRGERKGSEEFEILRGRRSRDVTTLYKKKVKRIKSEWRERKSRRKR